MSNTHSLGHSVGGTPPRVRDQAREALALMVFSAVAASGLALALLIIMTLGRQG